MEEDFDVHDPLVDHVEDEHPLRGIEQYIAVAWSVRSPGRMLGGAEALAEVVLAAARRDQSEVVSDDRQMPLALGLEQPGELGDEVGVHLPDQRILLHERQA